MPTKLVETSCVSIGDGSAYATRGHRFQKGHPRYGGRKKGEPNHTTTSSREAIIAALNEFGSDGKGRDGMIGFCKRLIEENIQNGLVLLQMITPRAVEGAVSHKVVEYQSVEDIDRELAKLGVRRLRDIFEIDFKGTPVSDEVAEIPEAEILPLEREPKKQ